MLVGTNFVQAQNLPFGDARQGIAFAVVVLLILFAIGDSGRNLVHAQVAIKFLNRAVGAERVIAGSNINGGLVENRRHHLRSHKALPDQLIQLEQIVVQIFAHVFRRAHASVGRTASWASCASFFDL